MAFDGWWFGMICFVPCVKVSSEVFRVCAIAYIGKSERSLDVWSVSNELACAEWKGSYMAQFWNPAGLLKSGLDGSGWIYCGPAVTF